MIKAFFGIRFYGVHDDRQKLLVVQIDDADLAENTLYDICEDMYHYLRLPNVIVLMATNFSLLRKSIRSHNLIEYRELLSIEGKEEVYALANKKAQEYIEKCFPVKYVIFLPSLREEWDRNKWKNIRYIYVKKKNGENYRLCSEGDHSPDKSEGSLKKQVSELFKRKTGIILSEQAENVFFKFRLRELNSFWVFFSELYDIDHPILQLNKELKECYVCEDLVYLQRVKYNIYRLQQYFENEWCHIHLKSEIWDDVFEYCQNLKYRCKELESKSFDNGKMDMNEIFKAIDEEESNINKIRFIVKMECSFLLIAALLSVIEEQNEAKELGIILNESKAYFKSERLKSAFDMVKRHKILNLEVYPKDSIFNDVRPFGAIFGESNNDANTTGSS